LPDPLAIVKSIHMERAIALVDTNLATTGTEELAGPEVPPESVEFGACFHGVHITSRPVKSVD
jgi:hypothetical protein